jgi:hypothetical protein
MNVLQFREFLKRIKNIDAFKDLEKTLELNTVFTEVFDTKVLSDRLLEMPTTEIQGILTEIWRFESEVYKI